MRCARDIILLSRREVCFWDFARRFDAALMNFALIAQIVSPDAEAALRQHLSRWPRAACLFRRKRFQAMSMTRRAQMTSGAKRLLQGRRDSAYAYARDFRVHLLLLLITLFISAS